MLSHTKIASVTALLLAFRKHIFCLLLRDREENLIMYLFLCLEFITGKTGHLRGTGPDARFDGLGRGTKIEAMRGQDKINLPFITLTAVTLMPDLAVRLSKILRLLWQALPLCLLLCVATWRCLGVVAFVLPSATKDIDHRLAYELSSTSKRFNWALCTLKTWSPGYIQDDDNGPPSPSKRGRKGCRNPTPSHSNTRVMADLQDRRISKNTYGKAIDVGIGKKDWVKSFEHLQGLTVRLSSDYEAAFSTCHAAQRPFECLSLLRYMIKDGLPRRPQWYASTAQLSIHLRNWITALDTYMLFERKEEVRGVGECLALAALSLSAMFMLLNRHVARWPFALEMQL